LCIWFIDCELFISIFQVGNYHQQTIMNATSYSNNLWTNQVWPIPGQSKSSYFRHSQSEWRNSIHPIGVEYFVSTWRANSTVPLYHIFQTYTPKQFVLIFQTKWTWLRKHTSPWTDEFHLRWKQSQIAFFVASTKLSGIVFILWYFYIFKVLQYWIASLTASVWAAFTHFNRFYVLP
jgi:hypothetical protein